MIIFKTKEEKEKFVQEFNKSSKDNQKKLKEFRKIAEEIATTSNNK